MGRKMLFVSCVMALLSAALVKSELVLPLDSKKWTLTNENGTLSLTTALPAYPLEVLRSQGVIDDPLYRYGEMESRWVAMETWTFSTTISADEVTELLAQQQVVLQLGGVDTYADVSINGGKVLETTNFHRQWTVAIKEYLKAGKPNTLTIAIRSAFKESLKNKKEYPYHIPTLYNTGSIGAYNFARKPAFDFGWDWGPAFAASGIYGSVNLIAFSQPTLAGSYIAQTPTDAGFKLVVSTLFYVPPVDSKGFLTVSLPELKLSQKQELAFDGARLSASDVVLVKVESEFSIDKSSVQLWWPAGGNYGPHKLYDVEISFTPDGSICNGVTGPSLLDSSTDLTTLVAEKEVQQPARSDADAETRKRMRRSRPEPEEFEEPSTPEEAMAALDFADADQAEGELLESGVRAPANIAPSTTTTTTTQKRSLLADAAASIPTFAPPAQVVADATTSQTETTATTTTKPVPPSTNAQADEGPSTLIKDLLGAINKLKDIKQKESTTASDPSAATQCSFIKKRIGFRTVELVMEPLPEAVKDLFGSKKGFEFNIPPQKVGGLLAANGAGQWANDVDGHWSHFSGNDIEVDGATPESFYFKVNGIPIFMKGANVIPMSVLPSNTTPELIMATLQAAVDSNQNMLRVWGGGLYHTEDFYNFCDENGLMIWQDAMFGGSHYPRTPEWLANYAEEIAQQARRLSWHPSVGLWCGNNEIDLSYEWGNSTVQRSNRNMFVVDYQAVFIDTVRKQIKQVNPATIFVDSSPYKGAILDTPDLYIKRWGWIGDPRYGTIHSYNYMSDCEDFRSYPLGKFVSEFGWQSYPLPETYAAAMDPQRDWGVGNPMNEFRNRRTDVTPEFLQQYAKHFKLPKDWNPANTDERMRRFRSYLWIGNMQHMRCYETALNFWRRLRSNAKSLTMGVMYWQLNDIWAGASWSSIDVSGRWKPVHYAVKRAYAPLAVQAVMDGSQAQVFVVSDLVDTAPARITLRLVSLSDSPSTCRTTRTARRGSSDISIVESFDYDVPGLFATRVWKMDVSELVKARPGCTPTTCYLSVTAEAEGADPTESQLWLTQFKNMQLPDPNIFIDDVTLISPIEVSLTVRSERPAALVLLSAAADRVGHFTDNGFNLDPCEPRTVTYISHNSVFTERDLKDPELFSAESLFDHSSWRDDAKSGAAVKQPTPSAPGAQSKPNSKNGRVQ